MGNCLDSWQILIRENRLGGKDTHPKATLKTVDGRNPANQWRMLVYPIIYRDFYIPGGCFGFLPSTVKLT